MTAEVDRASDNETCQKLISLGYARSKSVRLYGEEVKLVSDPFSQEGEIVVQVEVSGSESRTMKLPLSVLQVAAPKKAA